LKLINDFVSRLGVRITFEEKLVVKKQNRYFLLNPQLKNFASEGFFYAGTYLGKVKDGVFFPSFNLLSMIAERKEANKIFVDNKTEWLFICGRDIFKQGVTKVAGSKKKGDLALVLNQRGECLGFGKMLFTIDADEKNNRKVIVKNIADIGDFLRREKYRLN
jgi:ribosome biogenesis protein Nip4